MISRNGIESYELIYFGKWRTKKIVTKTPYLRGFCDY